MTELEVESKSLEGPLGPDSVSYSEHGEEESLPKTTPNTSDVPNAMEPSGAGNGVVVTVTHYPIDRPLSSSSLQPLGEKNTLPDPFSPENMEKGLSTLSLEVMTSGEHLNTLSLEDLSSHGSTQDSAGSSEGEGEDTGLCLTEGELEKMEAVMVETVMVEEAGGQVTADREGQVQEEREACPKDVTAIVEAGKSLFVSSFTFGHCGVL